MYSEKVTKFITQGAKLYSAKDYEQAASSYADACAAFNEEHSRDDPDLLFLYGKALFQNGVAKSSVLGGVSSGPQKPEEEDSDGFRFDEGMAEDDGHVTPEDEANTEEQDDSEDENGAPEDAPEEEETDFEAAWNVLDSTCALFEELKEDLAKENPEPETPHLASDDDTPKTKYVETVKKLSETYDLLGEVSLETENFSQAAADLQACLELRQKLYDNRHSSLISESHYKLSLALEFCAEDPESRAKAAGHVQSAIAILKAQVELDSDAAKKGEKAELLRDLQERLKELQKDPEQEIQAQQLDIIKGLLGEAGPASRALAETVAKAPVNDLSSMVKKRKAKPEGEAAKKQKKE